VNRTDPNETTIKLVVAVTPSALFDLREAAPMWAWDEPRALLSGQGEREMPLAPGSAFYVVKKLLALNEACRQRVEVVLLSPHSAAASVRLFDSIAHHGLAISRAAFAGGAPLHRYAAAFGAHLLLSTDAEDVRLALQNGIAAATVQGQARHGVGDDVVRLAFDGDAVLFSDEAEQVYAGAGLAVFQANESKRRHIPLSAGPFKALLARLCNLQAEYGDGCPIRTALVTARGAPAHERAIRTLQAWGLQVDEACFLGGLNKGPFLAGFGADLFFDDQQRNCDQAAAYVCVGHVPYGVKNPPPARSALRLVKPDTPMLATQ
jgi:5'-nucleotidase